MIGQRGDGGCRWVPCGGDEFQTKSATLACYDLGPQPLVGSDFIVKHVRASALIAILSLVAPSTAVAQSRAEVDRFISTTQIKGSAAYESGDYAEALRGFRECAEEAEVLCILAVGFMYRFGLGVTQDRQTAAGKYILAGLASIYAQLLVGNLYSEGDGVRQDLALAESWWREAANSGHPAAQFYLGQLYTTGRGVSQDDSAAVEWYRKAADKGFAAAQLNLGLMYHLGRGIPQDYVRAHMWYNLAGAQGLEIARTNRDQIALQMNPAQIAEAQRLARVYAEQHGS